MLYNIYFTNVNLLSNIKALKYHIDSRVAPGEKNACWQNVSLFSHKTDLLHNQLFRKNRSALIYPNHIRIENWGKVLLSEKV